MRLFVPLIALCLLAGCTAAPAQTVAPPMPAAKPAAKAAANHRAPAPQLDLRCHTDDDCTVKNVGNCCGAFPACVNVDSPTDPAAVMAQCQASGRMSVCGFPAISACQCVSGQCSAKPASADTLRRPIDSPEPIR